ncbi:MAG: hypothetical protein ABI318_16540 [Chthoniobacteraceae bacterium]
MAGSAEHDKQAIVAELAAARARLSATGDALRRSLDVSARAKESFTRHRPAWLGGAAIVGFVLSKLPSRKRTVFVERATGKVLGAAGKLGALFSAARFAINFARPLVSELAGSSLGEILRRFHRPAKPEQPDNTRKP